MPQLGGSQWLYAERKIQSQKKKKTHKLYDYLSSSHKMIKSWGWEKRLAVFRS